MVALLLRRPVFARLFAAVTISLVGDWLTFVAISVLAASRGHGALALAGVLAAHTLPGALASPVAGVLADRFDRRTLLLFASLAQALLTVGMAVAALQDRLGAVQLLLVARSAVAAIVPPAEAAALRHVVDDEELLAANALVASTWSLAYVGGMALGGALATLGPALAILLDAGTFVASAALVATLPRMRPPPRAEGASGGFGGDVADALVHLRARPALLRATLAKVPVSVAGGGAWLALNLAASTFHPLGSAALSLGVLQAARGAGTGVGPLLATALARRGIARSSLAGAAYVLAFSGMVAFAYLRSWLALLVAALAWGTGSGANWVLSQSALQRRAGGRADHQRKRRGVRADHRSRRRRRRGHAGGRRVRGARLGSARGAYAHARRVRRRSSVSWARIQKTSIAGRITPPRSVPAAALLHDGVLRPARARDAPMLRTRPARDGDLPPQRLARTKHADGGVVLRDPLLHREARDRDAVDLDAPERIRVLGLQHFREPDHATADLAAHHLGGLLGGLDLLGKPSQRAIGGLRAPVVVDRRVPERPIEPGHDRFAVAKTLELRQPARERLLKNVFREITPTESALEEAQELAVVVHEHALDVGIDRSLGLGFDLRLGHAPDLAHMPKRRRHRGQLPAVHGCKRPAASTGPRRRSAEPMG